MLVAAAVPKFKKKMLRTLQVYCLKLLHQSFIGADAFHGPKSMKVPKRSIFPTLELPLIGTPEAPAESSGKTTNQRPFQCPWYHRSSPTLHSTGRRGQSVQVRCYPRSFEQTMHPCRAAPSQDQHVFLLLPFPSTPQICLVLTPACYNTSVHLAPDHATMPPIPLGPDSRGLAPVGGGSTLTPCSRESLMAVVQWPRDCWSLVIGRWSLVVGRYGRPRSLKQ